MEGGFEDDDVFGEENIELQPLIPRHESLAHELEQSPAWAQTQFTGYKTDIVENKVDAFYKSTGLTPNEIDYNQFTVKDGHLFLIKSDNSELQLTHRNNPSKFFTLDTLKNKLGSVSDIRNLLGLSEYKSRISSRAASALHKTQRKLPNNVEDIPMQDLPGTASETIHELETSFTEDPPLPMR